MKNHVQQGKTLTFTAGADTLSGAGVLLGSGGLFGVSNYDVLNGEKGEATLEGVFDLPKLGTDTPAEWATAYWDNTNSRTTTTATGNTRIGVYTEAYASGTTTANVKLIPALA